MKAKSDEYCQIIYVIDRLNFLWRQVDILENDDDKFYPSLNLVRVEINRKMTDIKIDLSNLILEERKEELSNENN